MADTVGEIRSGNAKHAKLSENREQVNAKANPRLRVVRIIDRLNIGGPAKHVTWLTAGLNGEEFETLLITGTVPPEEGDMSYFAREAGIEPLLIKEMSRELSPRDILVILKLLRVLLQFKPQIVHTHKAKAGAVGRLSAFIYKWLTPSALWLKPRDCRIVHTFHGHIFHSYYGEAKTKVFLAIERALARICTDRIVTISSRQKEEISQRFKVGQPGQHVVIPLGIDFEEFGQGRNILRDLVRIDEQAPLIGIVGRLCEVKNHALLLDAAAKLKREGIVFHLMVIGDGHLRNDLENQMRALGLENMVTFTGFRSDVVSLYPELDIVALTSLNEGTPLTLIEAMSCGVTAISTEVGGVIDLMGERQQTIDGFKVYEHGITSPSQDAEAYARGLRYLIERPAMRRNMGERGREFIRSRMSKERLVGDIENLYREMLDAGC